MSDELVEEVARMIRDEAGDIYWYVETNRRYDFDAIARAAIAVVIEWCADAVNGLAYGDAVEAIRKLGERE